MPKGVEQTPPSLPNIKRSLHRSRWIIEDIENSLRLVPDAAERDYGLALIQVMKGKFGDALAYLNRAVEANANHTPALYLLGDLHFKLGNYEKAAETLEKLTVLEPDNLTAITWLCLAYFCLGNQGKAINKQSILQTIAPDLVVSLIK